MSQISNKTYSDKFVNLSFFKVSLTLDKYILLLGVNIKLSLCFAVRVNLGIDIKNVLVQSSRPIFQMKSLYRLMGYLKWVSSLNYLT